MAWHINANSPWTPERDATATRMWLAGDSATIIGRELHCSRNAVIGRLRRLGIERETAAPVRFVSYPATRTKVRTARKSLKSKPMRAKMVPVLVQTVARPFMDLKPQECRYSLFDPGPGLMDRMLCCAAPTPFGEPYCAYHHKVCWVPAKQMAPKKAHWHRINGRRAAA